MREPSELETDPKEVARKIKAMQDQQALMAQNYTVDQKAIIDATLQSLMRQQAEFKKLLDEILRIVSAGDRLGR